MCLVSFNVDRSPKLYSCGFDWFTATLKRPTRTCQMLSLLWNKHLSLHKSVYSRRASASYSAFIIGYRLWPGVGEDAARAGRHVLEYGL
jgi:hypothetical protein